MPTGGQDEHRAWAAKVWLRFDRDSNGYLSKQELDCEEFRVIIKSLLVPESAGETGGAAYARPQMNTEEALNFYFRKADINRDSQLSFEEFESFTRFLRFEPYGIHYTANLIFSLFDLNADRKISRDEFKEIFTFYLGHQPTEKEFAEEWSRLDYFSHARVDREQYINWLQSSPHPICRRHAAPAPAPADGTGSLAKSRAAGGLPKARWNTRFAASEHPYFSRPQSMPELKRYYKARRGFKDHLRRLDQPEPPKLRPVISAVTMPMIVSRHVPGGSMRSPETGKRTQWVDNWQVPLQLKDKYQAGTIGLRCPGTPPRHLYADLYEDEF